MEITGQQVGNERKQLQTAHFFINYHIPDLAEAGPSNKYISSQFTRKVYTKQYKIGFDIFLDSFE